MGGHGEVRYDQRWPAARRGWRPPVRSPAVLDQRVQRAVTGQAAGG